MTVAPGPEDAIVTAIAAWNAGDREGFIGMSHPDVVWKMAGLFPGLRSTYRGHDEMREFWDAFHEPWETLQIEIGEMAELDCESLLVAVHFHAKGRGGIEVDRRMANHIELRDGKLVHMQTFSDWEKAIAGLGIEDPRGNRMAS